MAVLDGYSNYYDYRYIKATKLYKGNRVIKREYNVRKVTDEKFLGRFKLADIVQQDMIRPIPAAPGLSVHWFIVNNKVPPIACGLGECSTKSFIARAQNQILAKHASNVNFLDTADANRRLDAISKLAASFYQRQTTLKDLEESGIEEAILDAINRQLFQSQERGNIQSKAIVLPRVEHLLTKEHVFFLKEIRNTIRRAATSMDTEAQSQLQKGEFVVFFGNDAVFAILRNSPALTQLLPELAHFFATEITRPDLKDISVLITFAEVTSANDKIQLHSHAHQFLVPLLDILLSVDDRLEPNAIYTRLRYRQLAASAIGRISKNLRIQENGLEGVDSVLMSIYKRAIARPECTLSMLYGALCGIKHLPLHAKRIIFYPMVPLLMTLVLKMHAAAKTDLAREQEPQQSRLHEFRALLCHHVLEKLVTIFYHAGVQYLVDEDASALISQTNIQTAYITDMLQDSVANPETFVPVYCAILSRFLDNFEHGAIQDNESNITCPISNAKRYMQLYQAANSKRRRVDEANDVNLVQTRPPSTPPQDQMHAAHAMELVI
ncbi:bifunctional TAF6 [Babesia duncani]|uniref:Bifunctional TAF6 n=1 Tax=Babesia duncani TaxID=323732 RepID=A0AAD9PK85_9APIC|nr:bifunctional TAF6 [Babesia duncani]